MQAQIKRLRKLRLRRERLRRERSVWICVSFPVSYACLFTRARRRWRVRLRTDWSPPVRGSGALRSRPFASTAAEIGTARTIRMCGGCLKMTRTILISFRTIGSGSFEEVGDEGAVRGGSCRSGLFMGWCEGKGGYVMFVYTQRSEHPPPKDIRRRTHSRSNTQVVDHSLHMDTSVSRNKETRVTAATPAARCAARSFVGSRAWCAPVPLETRLAAFASTSMPPSAE